MAEIMISALDACGVDRKISPAEYIQLYEGLALSSAKDLDLDDSALEMISRDLAAAEDTLARVGFVGGFERLSAAIETMGADVLVEMARYPVGRA